MKPSKDARHLVYAISAALTLAALGFACGSEKEPPTCEGAACVDGGGSEVSSPEGSAPDGSAGDATRDAPSDTDAGLDASICVLPEAGADPDAGPSGTLQWAKNFGVTGFTYPTAVARDPANGDIVVTGYFWGTTDFGGGALTSVAANDGSGSDVFVVRFDKNGAYKWAKAAGNGQNTGANGVAVDAVGNVLIGGVFRGAALDFGGGALPGTGSSSVFLVKFNSTGNYQWGKTFGTVGEFAGLNTVAADASGNAVIAGSGTSLDLGGGALSGFILAKFSSGGTHVWSKGFAATTSYGGPYAMLDVQGNTIFAGSFSKSIDLGGGALNTAGADAGDITNAAFAAKFDRSGKHVWSHHYGEGIGGKNTSITGATTDPCGNVILHGPFFGVVNFGAGQLSGTDGSKDYAFLAKLSPTGSGLSSNALTATFSAGNANAFGLGGVVADATGGFTIAPRLMGDGLGSKSTADFGGGPLTSVGRGSVAIASFDKAGSYRWAYGGGAPSTATASFAAFPTAGAAWGSSLVVTGAFNKCTAVCSTAPAGTTLVLAGKTLTAVSGQDLFIAAFAP